jgi:hypothetical protein
MMSPKMFRKHNKSEFLLLSLPSFGVSETSIMPLAIPLKPVIGSCNIINLNTSRFSQHGDREVRYVGAFRLPFSGLCGVCAEVLTLVTTRS